MSDKVVNPETGKLITVRGAIFNRLVKSGQYRYDPDSNKLVGGKAASLRNASRTESPQQQGGQGGQHAPLELDEEIPDDGDEIIQDESGPPEEASRLTVISEQRLDYLIHISDVHIPLNIDSNGRKREYLLVFRRLYAQISELLDSHDNVGIAITGDLLHTKITLKPDCSVIARQFLYQLAELAPVFLITGNHDMNEYNLDETCTLTSIVQYLHPNVHYLEYSGLYRYGNRVLVVSSLKDAVFIQRRDIPDELVEGYEERLIYLYHGFLTGATTDSGYGGRGGAHGSASSRYRSVGDFKGFPTVLLGDVHKQQSLRQDDSMAYAGSLLQVDRGESVDRHGFLFWDLDRRKYTFHRVASDYGFVKLKIANGEVDLKSLNVAETSMPRKPVIFCQLNNTTLTQFEQAKTQLETRFKPVDIRLDNRPTAVVERVGGKPDRDIKPANREDEIEMIRGYNKIIPENMDAVLKIHEAVDARVKRDNVGNYDFWDLVSLEFQNIFIYGNNRVNHIDFEAGVTNISAANRNGKSSICYMIMFALFHKTSFDSTQKSDILNKWAQRGYIKLVFRHNQSKYIIKKTVTRMKRTGKRMESGDVFKTEFSRIEPEYQNLEGTTSTETVDNIQKYVGNFDNFIANNTLLTRLTHSILYQKPSERIKRFQALFQLNCYDQHVKLSKTQADRVKTRLAEERGELKTLEALPTASIEALDRDLTANSKQLDSTRDILNLYVDELAQLQEQKTEVENELLNLKSGTCLVDEPEASWEQLQELHKQLVVQLADVERPDKSLELVQHELARLKIDTSQTLDRLEAELAKLEASKPELPQEQLSLELARLNRRETEWATELKLLNRQLSELAESPGSVASISEQVDPDTDPQQLVDMVQSLTDAVKPVAMEPDELRAKIAKLKRVRFDKLKRKSIATTEQLVNDYLIKCGELKASLRQDVEEYELSSEAKGDLDGELNRLETEIKPLELVPDKLGQATREMLAEAQQAVETTQQKIKRLERVTGQIDLDQTVKGMRQTLDRSGTGRDVAVDRQLLTDSVKVLELANKGTFRQLALCTQELKQWETRITEIEAILERDQKIADVRQGNLEVEQHNNQTQLRVNYVNNLIVESESDRYERLIKAMRGQITLLEQQAELRELTDMLAVVEDNERIEAELALLNRQLSWLKRYRIQQQIELVSRQLSEIPDQRQVAAEQIEWYQSSENLTERIRQLTVWNRLESEGKVLRQFSRLEQVESDIEQWQQYRQNRENLGKIQQLEEKLGEVRAEITELDQTVSDARQQSFVLEQQISGDKTKIQEQRDRSVRIEQLREGIIELEREVTAHKSYQEMWNPKGLPLMLLKRRLKTVEPMINELFTRYTGYRMEFDVADETRLNISIVCGDGDAVTHLGLDRLSGSEYSFLNLAFKSVCNKLSPHGRSTLFIIDESMDSLDSENWQKALPEIFQMMKTDYLTVLFISHREIPDEIIDGKIRIRRQGNCSAIWGN